MYGSVLAFPSERKVILKVRDLVYMDPMWSGEIIEYSFDSASLQERASASYHLSAYFMVGRHNVMLLLPMMYPCFAFRWFVIHDQLLYDSIKTTRDWYNVLTNLIFISFSRLL